LGNLPETIILFFVKKDSLVFLKGDTELCNFGMPSGSLLSFVEIFGACECFWVSGALLIVLDTPTDMPLFWDESSYRAELLLSLICV
jgi:hypothetical protein